MENQEKKVDNQGILFDKDKEQKEKKDNENTEKDGKGMDYIPPTPEPATDSSRKHNDPIRDRGPSTL
ncbi:hypothetical protein PQ465_14920 [Sphingobacterium oryzagri]|uniref:Uncharacterized protein n=1 Tax=Sphingobacterium oryzagri TaxID=3025669 RepID=A0ABY7WFA9_9SPHI|nr:hypothetical protein [Sphingobacterium sp. KACC 22765]WDF67590.1 hypothetical protein PQ465_14920 [Sphingobacterium sp. KACC 22765]